MWHGALGCFNERWMSMKAVTVSPTICPRGLIMQVEIKMLIAQTQRRYYFREPVEFGRHAVRPAKSQTYACDARRVNHPKGAML